MQGATPTAPRAVAPAAPPVVSLRGATKTYGPNKALTDVDFDLRAGEVMCLAGENGAGKSTLIKILTGAIDRDSGEYTIDGTEIGRPSPSEARAHGVGVVYQELSLLPDLSVAENLMMSRLPSCAGRRARCSRASSSTTSPPTRSSPSCRSRSSSSSRSRRCSASRRG
jgi:ABC-type sugar transport system ATPase subunit